MNIRKIILITVLVIFGLILILTAFLSNPKNFVFAQKLAISKIICDEPIPMGQVIEESSDLANAIYLQLAEAKKVFNLAIGQLTKDIADLSIGKDEVCDYSLCKPKVSDIGAGISLDIKSFWGKAYTLFGLNIPMCSAKPCEADYKGSGSPCPDLTQTKKILQDQRDEIEKAYNAIHDLITKKTELVTEDINKSDPDDLGDKITRPELVKRRLQVVREWLSSSAETGKQSCALSDLERKRVADGLIGSRFPMRCADALKEYLYWPKAWAENMSDACVKACKKYPTGDFCKKMCLADSKNNASTASALAKINYTIYGWTTGLCGAKCSEGELDKNCLECLSKKANKVGDTKLSDSENFISWICGGHYNNYVCCHETEPERE